MLLYTHCDCIVATTTVPSGPPQNFTVMTNSNFHLLLTWSPPLLSQRNGVIIFYAVVCIVQNTNHTGGTTSTRIGRDFSPWPATKYTCFVRAETVAGYGPSANFSGIIGDGMFCCTIIIFTSL